LIRQSMQVAVTLVLALCVGACASHAGLSCQPGERLAVIDSLYFGTAMPQGVVTPEQWREFVERVVTPRFPQGLTSWEATGQWQAAPGAVVRESTHVLQIAHADTRESETAIVDIIGSYKSQFRQEAVLRVRAIGCTSF